MNAPQRPAAAGALPGPTPGGEGPVRVITVEAGQQLQATVAQALGDGRFMIGVLGGRIEAFSHIPLEVGRSYEFTVASTEPRIVLSAAKPVVLPSLASATQAGVLGLPAASVSEPIRQLLSVLNALTDRPEPHRIEFAKALTKLDHGTASAQDLELVVRQTGVDQEVRVARLAKLPPAERSAQAARLQATIKADALRLLQAQEPLADEVVQRAARQLVEASRHVEVDNAQRSEQGAPTWLPLPIGAGSAFRDARLYLLAQAGDDDREQSADSPDRQFTVVLLLELTKLGPVRVDVKLRGAEVTAVFQLVDAGASESLRAALAELHTDLEAADLEVRSLSVRHVPERLPLADLAAPSPGRDPQSMVDIHV